MNSLTESIATYFSLNIGQSDFNFKCIILGSLVVITFVSFSSIITVRWMAQYSSKVSQRRFRDWFGAVKQQVIIVPGQMLTNVYVAIWRHQATVS